ncbi:MULTISPECIES: hypothetical protein [unclassified Streptomyces]|uniref:hypothetical protein n=1 Tax=unclassified Streptomyces TaxID=2593676 RepID=UPI002E2170D6
MRRSGKAYLSAGMASMVLLGLTACDSKPGSTWKEPAKGQAVAVLQTDADNKAQEVAYDGFGGTPEGITYGPDGLVYGLGTSLVTITKDHKAKVILDDQIEGMAGLVALPGGKFLTSADSQLVELGPGRRKTALAGVAGKNRKLRDPAPKTVSASQYHFAASQPVPFAAEPDGSIMIADYNVIWRLKDGHLTRIYQIPGRGPAKDWPAISPGGAASGTQTLYVSPSTDDPSHVGGITAIGADGSSHTITLPRHIAGVPGDPASLKVRWMTDDGADGIYVHAGDSSGSYVLHLAAEKAELVAKHSSKNESGSTCKPGKPVDAKNIPCEMPTSLAYSSGSLIMAGLTSAVLKISTK